MTTRPKARTDVLLRDVEDEAVVYDFETHKAHCLNRTALAIFRLADGTRTHAGLARDASKELGGTVTTACLGLALDALQEAKLLQTSGRSHSSRRLRPDRRQWLETMAVSAIAIPAVWSILAPTPAYAQSAPCIQAHICTPGSKACCGAPGTQAMSCDGMGMCNSNASLCMGVICR